MSDLILMIRFIFASDTCRVSKYNHASLKMQKSEFQWFRPVICLSNSNSKVNFHMKMMFLHQTLQATNRVSIGGSQNKICEIAKLTLGPYFEIFWLCTGPVNQNWVSQQLVPFNMLNQISEKSYTWNNVILSVSDEVAENVQNVRQAYLGSFCLWHLRLSISYMYMKI